MCYSVWSRGRLVGHTDLGFEYRLPGFRMGWFQPTDVGDKLMPMATGVAPAMRASYEAGADVLSDPDVVSAFNYEQALELELRAQNGSLIKTESIAIIDTDYLLSIADREIKEAEFAESTITPDKEMFKVDVDDLLAEFEHEERWHECAEFPRYQIQACVTSELNQ